MLGYRVDPGDEGSHVILHVPHASSAIPPDIRRGLLLDDAELAAELAHMTDAYTDVIAARATAAAAHSPWSFVNSLSRLVVDPERFPDQREDMRAVGMGAVYTRTHDGRPLRRDDEGAEADLLGNWFAPYSEAIARLVAARLAAVDAVMIIDVHSYPSRRLPYEIGGEERPAICLGTHEFHTSDWLLAAAKEAFASCGDIGENSPFAGCYVPERYFETDSRVGALMVEIRRDVYMAEPGGIEDPAGVEQVSAGLARLIDAVT